MTDISVLKTRLSEAEEAYHQLQMGAKEQEMQLNGRRVVYTPANASRLLSYISELKAQIAKLDGSANGRKHPIYLRP